MQSINISLFFSRVCSTVVVIYRWPAQTTIQTLCTYITGWKTIRLVFSKVNIFRSKIKIHGRISISVHEKLLFYKSENNFLFREQIRKDIHYGERCIGVNKTDV